MGMERVVQFTNAGPAWPTIRERLDATGIAVQMRMIDNMPAFPDEEPADDWQELRMNFGGGMITVRREPGRVRVIVWGNADEALLRDRETMVRIWAEAGDGIVL